MATTYTWKSVNGSGNWTSTTNWTGGIVGDYPGEGGSTTDAALIKAPATGNTSYTVTFDPTALTIGALTLSGTGVKLTTLALTGGNTLTVDGAIVVGNTNSTTGSAIMGTGTLQAGGGVLVNLTTGSTGGLINTTGAANNTGIASSVILGDANVAGTVLDLGGGSAPNQPATLTSLNNTFGFSGGAGATLELTETSATSLNYTGTIDGLNLSSSSSVLTGVNYINVQGSTPITSIDWTTGGFTFTLMNGSTAIQTVTLGSAITAGESVDFINDSSASGQVGGQVSLGGQDVFLSSVVCFAAGTRILTAAGEVAVEDLAEGDQVVTLDGAARTSQPVAWIGYRRVDLAAHPRRELVAPVRIRRGAFAENRPHTDLVVSPDHALFVDGKLVVARLLINGMTITQDMQARSVEYYHVELPAHAILLAEGLPTESYLDTGNRAMFSNAGLALVLHPDFAGTHAVRSWDADACAPLVTEAVEVEPIWRALAERAELLGYTAPQFATTADADLHLMVDGRLIRPVSAQSGRNVFLLPRQARSVRLVSRIGAPADVAPYLEDRRQLGVAVSRLVLRLGTEQSEIPVDHPMLSRGWHAVERDMQELRRWTDGDAYLPIAIEGGAALAMLEVHTTCGNTYRLDESVTARRLAA